MTSRVVALIDMDCFYCQVETRLRPELLGTPVAVVQYKTWKGGGIIAVNYEARDAGVTRFMRGDEAKAQCPSITLCSVPEVRGKADLTRYRDAGREVIQVFSEFSRCVERASVDEAFIDLTEVVEKRMEKPVTADQLPNTFVVGFSPTKSNDLEDGRKGVNEWLYSLYDSELDDVNTKKLAVGAAVVEEIRAAVYAKTGFRCSAGIAHNKIIAKLAAGLHKPNRQTVLPQSGVPILFSDLPVKKVRNLGGKLGVAVTEELGCKVMADLIAFSLKDLQTRFDEKTGTWLYNIARGADYDQVAARLIPKSIGCSKRFPGNASLATVEDVSHWLGELSSEVSERLKDDLILNNRSGKVLTVMAACSIDGKWNSFSRSGPLHSYEEDKIAETAMTLIKKSNTASAVSGAWSPALICLGVSVGKFIDTPPGFNNIKQFFSASLSRSKSSNEQGRDIKKAETCVKIVSNAGNSTNETGEEVAKTKQLFSAVASSSKVTENKRYEKNVELLSEESNSNDFVSALKKEDNPRSHLLSNQKNNSDRKEPKSFFAKYFKKDKNKITAIEARSEVGINDEGSDTSNDQLQDCDSTEAKSILISGSDKAQDSIGSMSRNANSFLETRKEDKPSTSFFQPDCNSTALDTCDTKLGLNAVKDHSDYSNEPSYETDESNDCWKTINEIFPDLNNIDLDVVQLLPKKLQDVLYSSDHMKKEAKNVERLQNEDSNPKVKFNFKTKVGRGRPPKKESGHKSAIDKTLSQYFSKADDSSKVTVKEVNQSSSSNRTLSQFFSRLDEESRHSDDAGSNVNEQEASKNENRQVEKIEEEGLVEVEDLYQAAPNTGDERIFCDNDDSDENGDKLVSSCDIFEEKEEEAAETINVEIEDVDLEEIPVGSSHDQCASPPINTFNRTTANETCIDMFRDSEQEELEPLPSKSSLHQKRETDHENDSDIINALTPVVLSDQTVDLSMIKCRLCNESVIVAAMPEHMDYHAALSLHKELNSASAFVSIPTSSSKPSSVSSASSSKVSKSVSNSGLKRKKDQSGKSPKKFMDIASFFSTR